jgi:hypothetical protein
MIYFNRLKYLKESEAWGNARKVSGLLMFVLDVVREEFDRPLIINCAWAPGTGHATNSYHYKGLAADFHIEGSGIMYQAPKMIEILNQLGVLNYGLGAYPNWNSPGWHLDLRADLCFWVSKVKDSYSYFKDRELFLKALAV